MIFTDKQEKAIKGAVQAFRAHEKRYIISGYAGSGKSTTVRAIIEALDIDEDFVCYATFTGKAAQVLQRKGNQNAKTLHKLLYETYPRPDGTFVRRPIRPLEYRVVVVDECSMAPIELVELLESHKNVFIIYLGDPGQLPPVSKDTDNHLLDHPDIFLDEIMRQAAESEIIRVSMDIREGRPLKEMDGKEVKIFNKNDINTGMLQWADQIIVGTNNRRKAINAQMRELLGKSGAPQDGDKLICLRNYWDTISNDGESLVNGSIGYLKNGVPSIINYPQWTGIAPVEIIRGNLELETGDVIGFLDMDKQMIATGDKTLDKKMEYKLNKMELDYLIPKEFEYGYAITCHKAQGSSWQNVLVFEEGFPFDREEHKRWLYTAATRAEDKLVIIKK